MVKLHCQLCDRIFSVDPLEYWGCCDMQCFDVFEISEEELNELWDNLDLGQRKYKFIKPSENNSIYLSVYDDSKLKEALLILPLLFEKLYANNLFDFDVSKEANTKLMVDSGIISPISTEFRIPPTDNYYCPIIANPIILNKLSLALAYEDARSLRDKKIEKIIIQEIEKAYGDKFNWPLDVIIREFERYNRELITISKLNVPFVVEPLIQGIHDWKMRRVTNLYTENIKKDYKYYLEFLKQVSLRVPLHLEFDEIEEFRKEKASLEFRKTIFSLVDTSRKKPDEEIIQKLLWEFRERREKFNEAANTYSDVGSAILTGVVSTLGGLIGGVGGAILGGLGVGSASPVTKYFFKKVYERNNKDWAYFFWKWSKFER